MGFPSNRAIGIDPSLMMVMAKRPPDPWQEKILWERPQRALLNCARQAGKTLTISCAALHEALYYAPALVLVLGPSERQSKRMLRTIKAIRNMMGLKVKAADDGSTTELQFPSGSEIIALPAKEQNIRGFSNVALLIIDEAARVPDDLYYAIKPMLAVSGGRIICLSTPFGKRGFFHKEWTEGENWDRTRITAEQCPRITPAFLAEEKRSLPANWFAQEYMCEFSDTEDSAFRYDDIMAAMSDYVQPFFGVPAQIPEEAVVRSPFLT